MRKMFQILLVVLVVAVGSEAQILHTENFSVILDTTKHFKGNILPSLKYRNLRENLLEFENTADFSISFLRNAVTLANKFELSKFGDETIQSGGFLYLEYRRLTQNKYIEFEPYFQMHWAEARGLDRKYALGGNFRINVIKNPKTGLFVGVGTFYEFERWNYDGVADTSLIPTDARPVETLFMKLSSYLSFKQAIGQILTLDVSAYYQSRFVRLFSTPRLAGSARVTYNLSKHLGLTLLYQNIYDPDPPVPIDQLFHDITFGLNLSF